MAEKKTDHSSQLLLDSPAGGVGLDGADAPLFTSYLDEQVWESICRRLELSDRECQIVLGILGDRKETSIAAELGISPHTVRTYCERLYRKIGVSNRVRLVLLIVEIFLSLRADVLCSGDRKWEERREEESSIDGCQ